MFYYMYLRSGQVEHYYVDVSGLDLGNTPSYELDKYCSGTPYYMVIKTFYQTDEEAGGVGEHRRANLIIMEGTDYFYNGIQGHYQNVGQCDKAPREYAVMTTLIMGPYDIITYSGDWDIAEMVKSINRGKR